MKKMECIWMCMSMIVISTLAFGQSPTLASKDGSDNTMKIYGYPLDPDRPVGSYNQPNWTTERMFGGTRTYLIPQHNLEVEMWYRPKVFKDKEGGGTEHLIQEEIEYGLFRHIQLDLYANQIKEPGDEKYDTEGQQIELRWALADWGKIFANPTIYLEYHPKKNEPAAAEIRFLFSDTLIPRLHWGVNLCGEWELWGDEKEHEYAVTGGLSYSVLDVLALGIESKGEWADVEENRSHFSNEAYVGPSIQIRGIQGMHLDLTWLFGANDDAHKAEGVFVAGLDLYN